MRTEKERKKRVYSCYYSLVYYNDSFGYCSMRIPTAVLCYFRHVSQSRSIDGRGFRVGTIFFYFLLHQTQILCTNEWPTGFRAHISRNTLCHSNSNYISFWSIRPEGFLVWRFFVCLLPVVIVVVAFDWDGGTLGWLVARMSFRFEWDHPHWSWNQFASETWRHYKLLSNILDELIEIMGLVLQMWPSWFPLLNRLQIYIENGCVCASKMLHSIYVYMIL